MLGKASSGRKGGHEDGASEPSSHLGGGQLSVRCTLGALEMRATVVSSSLAGEGSRRSEHTRTRTRTHTGAHRHTQAHRRVRAHTSTCLSCPRLSRLALHEEGSVSALGDALCTVLVLQPRCTAVPPVRCCSPRDPRDTHGVLLPPSLPRKFHQKSISLHRKHIHY